MEIALSRGTFEQQQVPKCSVLSFLGPDLPYLLGPIAPIAPTARAVCLGTGAHYQSPTQRAQWEKGTVVEHVTTSNGRAAAPTVRSSALGKKV